jgi:hypothetical protein
MCTFERRLLISEAMLWHDMGIQWRVWYIRSTGWHTWGLYVPDFEIAAHSITIFSNGKSCLTCVQLFYISTHIDGFHKYIQCCGHISTHVSTYIQSYIHHSFSVTSVQNRCTKWPCFFKIIVYLCGLFQIWLHQIVGKGLTHLCIYTLLGLFPEIKATETKMLNSWLGYP